MNDLLEVFKSLLCLNLNTEMYDEIMVKRSPALRLKGILIMCKNYAIFDEYIILFSINITCVCNF